MTTDPLARIALVAHSAWRHVLMELVHRLKERHGSTIHLYCTTPEEAVFYRGWDTSSLFASISADASVLNHIEPASSVAADALTKARLLEDTLGLSINSLTLSNRHFGRGFALGGFRHPRSRYSENTSYPQVIDAYARVIEFWQRELRDKRITLIINGSVELLRLARTLDIPARTIIHARHRNYHYWSHTEFFEHPTLEFVYENTICDTSAELSSPYKSHLDLRIKYLKGMGVVPLVRLIAWHVARYVYWRLHGYRKACGYYLSENIMMLVRQWRSDQFLTGRKMAQLSDLEGQKFVFFPLHTEPEAALQRASPEYFFQLAAIASLARDLPADHLLVVKETYENRGRRPDNFYDQIREFKNVVLLDMLELGLDVVKKARAVATISGTAGMEAAILGIPVVTFGRHNIYNFLPHVHPVQRDEDLRPAVLAALDDRQDRDRIARDGARFLAALKAASFDLRSLDLVAQNALEPEAAEESYRAFLAGLDVPSARMTANA
ncbi:MAG: capsular polysaccharide export protein, LipB/KpsS family [Alphaproteobacteria bacterium]